MLPVFFIVFFIGGIGEEIGWTGYVTDPLQERWNALKAGIILGIIWSVWHITPWLQAHYTPIWVAGQFGTSVVLRVLIVWIYNNTGRSVFAAILFHAISNLGRAVFPADQVYNPLVDYPGIHYSIIAITAVIVVILWSPKTLTRYRYASSEA